MSKQTAQWRYYDFTYRYPVGVAATVKRTRMELEGM